LLVLLPGIILFGSNYNYRFYKRSVICKLTGAQKKLKHFFAFEKAVADCREQGTVSFL